MEAHFGGKVVTAFIENVPEGADAERQRILDVEAQTLPGHEALIATLKADGQTSGPQAAAQVLSAERAKLAGMAAVYGAFFGLFPIGWIVLNIIFLHQLTEQNGSFKVLQDSLSNITEDRRIQLLLIAFSFGAFFEGAAGFGTPVAVTAAILIGLGFSPLAASGLSLIANTAPVAFGALGTPVITLAKVHGYDLMEVTAMIGRQLPFFSVLVPFWLIWAFAGRKGMMEIWPAILVTGLSFAIPQYLVSNFIGPELVDIIAAIVSMTSLILFLRVWQPKKIWTSPSMRGHDPSAAEAKPAQPVVRRGTGGARRR